MNVFDAVSMKSGRCNAGIGLLAMRCPGYGHGQP